MNMTISMAREQGELYIVSLADDCMSYCLNNVLFISLARNAVCVLPVHFHNAFCFLEATPPIKLYLIPFAVS